MKIKQIFLHTDKMAFLLLILIASAGCGARQNEKKEVGKTTPPPIVDVMIARNMQQSDSLEVNGTVIASETVEIRPEINGRLVFIRIEEGSRVSKGTVIARINDAELQAQLRKLSVQLQLAETTEQRLKKLLDLGGLNQADYDITLNQVNTLKADINIVKEQIQKTIIRAPFTGVIGLRKTSPGAYVTPSDVLATYHNTDQLKVDFNVPEAHAAGVQRGKTVVVLLDGQIQTTATIVAIEPQANTNTRSLLVRAILHNTRTNPGAFVRVLLPADLPTNKIVVPSAAIIPEDKDKILVVIKQGQATYTKVETGTRKGANVIIKKGITEGDTIVVTGVLFARPNSPVKIRSIKKMEEFARNF